MYFNANNVFCVLNLNLSQKKRAMLDSRVNDIGPKQMAGAVFSSIMVANMFSVSDDVHVV